MSAETQDRYIETKAQLTRLFQSVEASLNGESNHPFHAFRRQAMDKLQGLSFPTRRDEDWKYTSLNRLLVHEYAQEAASGVSQDTLVPFLIGGDEVIRLVFVNGRWDKNLSQLGAKPEFLVIEEIKQAMTNPAYKDLIEREWTQWALQSDSALVAMNMAFAQSGLFIHLPANQVVETPIHCIHIQTKTEKALLASPQMLVVAGKSAQLTVVDSFYSLDADAVYFTNIVNRFILEPNAVVYHYKLQNEALEAFQINHTEALVKRDGNFSSSVLDLGGRIVRNNISAFLGDSGTHTNLFGVYLGKGEQHIDSQTFIDHAFPHCTSNELYKGILTDRANGVFNGKVMVHKDAQKTNAYQQNSSLVLSEKAQMDTKPQLEIFADDVRCSHGATIGQLDESSVFYLKSRGFNDEQARSMLQHAFLIEVLENIHLDEVREMAERLVFAKFDA